MARHSETFIRVHEVMDVEKNLVLGKDVIATTVNLYQHLIGSKTVKYLPLIVIFNLEVQERVLVADIQHQYEAQCTLGAHSTCFLQACRNLCWIFMTPRCTRRLWSACKASSVPCMITGRFPWFVEALSFSFFSCCTASDFHNCVCSFHVLGNLGPSLTQDFYTIDGLALQISNSVLSNLDNVPDHRLRPLLHILLMTILSSST